MSYHEVARNMLQDQRSDSVEKDMVKTTPFTWHYNTSTIYYNSRFFCSYFLKKSIYLLKSGYLKPNLDLSSSVG